MAWNEPGKRDPWRGQKKGPDFDEMLRRLRERFNALIGGGGSGGGSTDGAGGGLLVVIAGVLLAWIAWDSWVQVNAREVGVVQRFGQKTRVLPPGINFKWPRPIESVTKVEITKVRSLSDNVRMLTQDENIVLIDFNVQYQVADAQNYLFKVKDPEETLKQASESAVRQVIGANSMDTIMSGQGAELVTETKKVLQKTLDGYDAGLIVTEVNFQSVAPPHEVKEAFDDVTNARESKQQIENEAQAYANKLIPEARGAAARIKAESEGYRAERIARAQGDADRFNLLVAQYKAAPDITRKRLYIETMQLVLSASVKVLDGSGGKNLIQLPLDRLAPVNDANLRGVAGALIQSTADDAARREGNR
ncbi:MAG: FtsH protease activity modulator HflK [Tahibacter sp.]